MLALVWKLLKDTVYGYIEDDALSRGAAIAYYTVFSIAPVLVIVISIAGLVYGEEAARGAIVGQLQGMMGHDGAEAIQTMVASASNKKSGTIGTILGFGALMLTASGVFGEMQSGLNRIWKAEPKTTTVSRLVRARAVSLGLVAALGFLLMVSLTVSAAVTAFGHMMQSVLPDIDLLFRALNFLISFALITLLFAAIYKILPDKPTTWHDVGVGAVATAFLFTVGKTIIGLYIGSSQVASSYGAAGALVVVLLWVYYSAQIFLLGAEFTRAWAAHHGSPAAIEAGPTSSASAS
ncbi:MAG: YihY/virulence factor BrkB family protein [Janthinobacterium lividum]